MDVTSSSKPGGRSFFRNGSLEWAQPAPPTSRKGARYYTYRAGVLLNVGRVDEAAAAIQRALALDPEAGDALAQQAIIQVVQNRKADALAGATRAVELSPDSSAARIALSNALQARPPRRPAVCDRQGARPQRPYALVL
jgi:Flp pilus assembly protein TadD